jgi:hypothetical protein
MNRIREALTSPVLGAGILPGLAVWAMMIAGAIRYDA